MKTNNPVKKAFVLKKLSTLFVKIKSMQLGFLVFL